MGFYDEQLQRAEGAVSHDEALFRAQMEQLCKNTSFEAFMKRVIKEFNPLTISFSPGDSDVTAYNEGTKAVVLRQLDILGQVNPAFKAKLLTEK